jgi:hypothetical protein
LSIPFAFTTRPRAADAAQRDRAADIERAIEQEGDRRARFIEESATAGQ